MEMFSIWYKFRDMNWEGKHEVKLGSNICLYNVAT